VGVGEGDGLDLPDPTSRIESIRGAANTPPTRSTVVVVDRAPQPGELLTGWPNHDQHNDGVIRRMPSSSFLPSAVQS
jgi:hypothetical protein